MFLEKTAGLAALFLIFCAPIFGQNQPLPDSLQGKLRVEFSDFGEFFLAGGQTRQKLSGNVRLAQDDAILRCDTAIISDDLAIFQRGVSIQQGDSVQIFADSIAYRINEKLADCFGNVVLENGVEKVFTQKLKYDLAQKIAHYEVGAVLSNGKTQIKSRVGDYRVNEKLARLEGDVVATDPDFTLLTDSIEFETERQIAYFLGPTRIAQNDGTKIYTEAGFYDTEKKEAEFLLHPQFIKGEQRGSAQQMRWNGVTEQLFLEGSARVEEGQKLTVADTIIRDNLKKTTLLKGRALFRDTAQVIEADRIFHDEASKSYKIEGRTRVRDGATVIAADRLDFNQELGAGFAEGNVNYQDTAQKMTVRAARLDYNKETNFMLAVGGAAGRTRPALEIEIDRDTLWMVADTLHSFKKIWRDSTKTPTARDTARVLTGHFDCRIFKKDLQAVCDSVSFDQGDSLFVFFKKGPNQPLLWSDSSQFSADTIRLALKNEKIDRMILRQKSFILSQPDPEIFNQIRGRDIDAFFKNGKSDRMNVVGSAEAVYFAEDEKTGYLGVNKTSAPEMRVFFDSGTVSGIRFLGKSDGKFTPMKDATKDLGKLDLEGRPPFEWDGKRPASVEELF